MIRILLLTASLLLISTHVSSQNQIWNQISTAPYGSQVVVDDAGNVFAIYTEYLSPDNVLNVDKYDAFSGSWNNIYSEVIQNLTDAIRADKRDGVIYFTLVVDETNQMLNLYKLANESVSTLLSDLVSSYEPYTTFDFKVGSGFGEYFWFMQKASTTQPMLVKHSGASFTYDPIPELTVFGTTDRLHLNLVGDTLWFSAHEYASDLFVLKSHKNNISFKLVDNDASGRLIDDLANYIRGDFAKISTNSVDRISFNVYSTGNLQSEITYINGVRSTTNNISDSLTDSPFSSVQDGNKSYVLSSFVDPLNTSYSSVKVLEKDFVTEIWDTLGLQNQILDSGAPIYSSSLAYSSISQRFVANFSSDNGSKTFVLNDSPKIGSLIVIDSNLCANPVSSISLFKEFSIADNNFDSLTIISITSTDQSVVFDSDLLYSTIEKIGGRTYFDIQVFNANLGTTDLIIEISDGYNSIYHSQNVTFNDYQLASTTDDYVCGDDFAVISASVGSGTISWFEMPSATSSIFDGVSFATGTITSDSTFYVEANEGGCRTTRLPVLVTYKTLPTVNSFLGNSICGTGTTNLTATPSSGATINWYSNPTGGAAIFAGNSFTTPFLTSTTNYFAEADDSFCTSATRATIVAQLFPIPSINTTTPASICGTGTATLGATASSGTISWFAASTGGSPLGTGTSFTTPSISTTTTYYAEVLDGACVSSRVAIDATVNPLPSITGTTPSSICGNGNLTLGATASSGTISWYAAPTGGTALGTGTSFTTPLLTNTTTYFIETVDASCNSGTRVAVQATIYSIPTINTTSPASICGTGTATLGATASAGTISWFTAASGGSSLATGTSFTTPSISTTTTYYVEVLDGACVSARTAIDATVYPLPTITGTTPATLCGNGNLTLGATASSGTISWYLAPTGGTALGTGTSFTTPFLTNTTTYFIETVNGTCNSGTRVAVAATINPLPVINTTSPASICGTGTVNIGATASSGTISWFAASTGGSPLGTGTSFTTPSISATTTYYVEVLDGACVSARTAIDATVNPLPTITSTTPSSICGNGNLTLGATASSGTISWYASVSGGTALSLGSSFATPNLSITTTYYVEANDGICFSSPRTSVIATINPLPIISQGTITIPSTCIGSDGSIEITGSGSGDISWTGTAAGLQSAITLPYLLPNFSAGTYIFSFSDGMCTSANLSITLNDPTISIPIVTAGGATTFCTGSNVSLTSSPATTYLWSTGETTQSINVSTSGSYNVSVSDIGCNASSSNTNVLVNPTPNITLGTIINTSTCGNTDGAIEITGSGTGMLSWTGTSTGSLTNVTLPFIINNLSAGNYNITFNNGCISNIVSASITDPGAPATPTISANGVTTFCAGGSVDLTSSSSTNNLWSTGETSQTITVNSSGSYSVNVNILGCSSSSAPTVVTEDPSPSISLGTTIDPSTCGNTDGSIQILGSDTGDLFWTGTSSGSASAISLPFDVLNLSAGNYNFTFDNGCISNQVSVSLNDPGAPTTPTITANGPLSFCSGGSVQLTASTAVNYLWSTGESTQSITVNSAGNYSVSVTVAACTSISNTEIITILNNSSSTETVLACDTYTWLTDGNTYSASGTYLATLTNAVGCDSIVTLNLTINNTTSSSENITACDTYTWATDGNTYSTSGTYLTTLTNVAGCDSIVTLNLTINNTTSGTEIITACDSYAWVADGNTYTSTGTYFATLTNALGCDSLVTLDLTINNSSSGTEIVTACETYSWLTDGNTYTSSGTYFTTLTNAQGCDSLVTLDLTINNSSSGSEIIIACETYTWPTDGNTYTTSGSYLTTLTNAIGCDSVVTLDLTINNSVTNNLVITSCNTYLFDGNILATSGNYNATFTSASGCDSVVNLSLTIINSPTINTLGSIEICEQEDVTLNASSNATIIRWFDQISGGNILFEGAAFFANNISNDSTFYVESFLNGCSSGRIPANILVNSKPIISISPTNSECGINNGSAIATISGGTAPFDYYWSDGSQQVLTINNLGTGSYYFNVEDSKACKAMEVTVISPTSISMNPTVQQISCFGQNNGSINLNITGITEQVTYLWNTGHHTSSISNLGPGTYEVSVLTESGCHLSAAFTINQASSIVNTLNSIMPLCGANNGQISVLNTIGGNAPYLYTWSNTQFGMTNNNLTFGSYTLTTTDQNACQVQQTILLSENGAPLVDGVVTPTVCNENTGAVSLDITPFNGIPIESIAWSNGGNAAIISDLAVGNYVSFVKGLNNCVAVNAWKVNIAKPDVQEICVVSVDSVTTTNLIVWEKTQLEGVSHYNIYRESNVIGDYQLIDTVQYSSLSVFNDVVASPLSRSWRYKISAVDFCNTESPKSASHKTLHLNTFDLGASGTKVTWDQYEGTAFSSYILWRHTDEFGWEDIASVGTTVLNFTDNSDFQTPGLDYMVEISLDEPCTAQIWRAQDFNRSRSNKEKGIFNAGQGTGDYSDNGLFENKNESYLFNIYPNPFNDEFFIKMSGLKSLNIQLIDLNGKLILEKVCLDGENQFIIPNLDKGIYFIKTIVEDELKIVKIIKN